MFDDAVDDEGGGHHEGQGENQEGKDEPGDLAAHGVGGLGDAEGVDEDVGEGFQDAHRFVLILCRRGGRRRFPSGMTTKRQRLQRFRLHPLFPCPRIRTWGTRILWLLACYDGARRLDLNVMSLPGGKCSKETT
jgi:hypothetical protein